MRPLSTPSLPCPFPAWPLLPLQPATPAKADVRDAVLRLVEGARRLPEMPPMPVNYDDLLADLQEWLAELEGVESDLSVAQQAAGKASADVAAQLAAADEEADPEGWHHLNWLRWGGADGRMAVAACRTWTPFNGG